MKVDTYRDFRLLTEISSEVSVTQRRLAKKFGLALGLTNFLIQRLVRKGYVKIVNLERKRLRYLITPKGLAAKAQLTYEYLEYSLQLYRSIRIFLGRMLSVVAQSRDAETVLVGTNEVAEIAFLILQQQGARIVEVIEEAPDGHRVFMGHRVRKPAEVPTMTCDWIVVASFQHGREIVDRLHQWGIPPQKILTIPDVSAVALEAEQIPTHALGASAERVVEAWGR